MDKGNFLQCVREANEEHSPTALKECEVKVDGISWSAAHEHPIFQSALLNQTFGDKGREKFDVDLETTTPDEFIDKQIGMMHGKNTPSKELFYRGVNEKHLKEVKDAMREGEDFPMLVLEYNKEGELKDMQEGRHRSVALKELGVDEVPIWKAKRCKERGCGDKRF